MNDHEPKPQGSGDSEHEAANELLMALFNNRNVMLEDPDAGKEGGVIDRAIVLARSMRIVGDPSGKYSQQRRQQVLERLAVLKKTFGGSQEGIE